MKYFSTRNKSLEFSFKDIFLRGLAPDGGLFLPSEVKKYTLKELKGLSKLSYVDLATEIIFNFCQEDIEKEQLKTLIKKAYSNFKNDPLFVDYLEDVSVLKYYGKTNIGSRPSKRGSGGKLNLSDLRAIPFVGAWTQMKQNVPGFYGVGAALKKYEDEGKLDLVKDFYKKSLFFRTLIDNSMQSICKTYFPLTSYLEEDQKF